MSEKRVVCLNCMDGRAQLPVIHWIKENHGADNVDMVTEPGLDGMLANQENSIDGIKKKIDISIEKNNAVAIYVVGHHDCKGNPVSDDDHKAHVKSGVERIKGEYSSIDVHGLWVNSDWGVDQL